MSYTEIDPTHTTSTFYKEYLKTICKEQPGQWVKVFIGVTSPNSAGFAMCLIYNTDDVNEDGLPRYSGGIAVNGVGGDVVRFGTNQYSFIFTYV